MSSSIHDSTSDEDFVASEAEEEDSDDDEDDDDDEDESFEEGTTRRRQHRHHLPIRNPTRRDRAPVVAPASSSSSSRRMKMSRQREEEVEEEDVAPRVESKRSPKRKKHSWIDSTCGPLRTMKRSSSPNEEMPRDDDAPKILPNESFLSSLVYPLSVEEFVDNVQNQDVVAFAVLGAGKHRIEELMNTYFFNGDETALIENSASIQEPGGGHVSVWLPPRNENQTLTSIPVTNPELCIELFHQRQASVYCRAPQDASDLLSGLLARQLGRDLSRDVDTRTSLGEVEVFLASTPGARTPPHTDFQSNFTLQLQGKKRWRLRRGPCARPLRGLTPHFSNMPLDVTEKQLVCLRMCAGQSANMTAPSLDEMEECCVVLEPGDFLYHPSGMWHDVTTLESDDRDNPKSLSINISLHSPSWADVLSSAMRQRMWRIPQLRAPVCRSLKVADLVDRVLAQAGIQLGDGLRASAVVPPPVCNKSGNGAETSMFLLDNDDDQAGCMVLDWKQDNGVEPGGPRMILDDETVLRNPLCVLISDLDIATDDREKRVNIVAHLNVGNDNFITQFRSEIVGVPKSAVLEVLSWKFGDSISHPIRRLTDAMLRARDINKNKVGLVSRWILNALQRVGCVLLSQS